MKKLLVLFLVLSTSVFAAQDKPLPIAECLQFIPFGIPTTRKTAGVPTICRAGYVLQHDNVAKIPMWVSYTLNAEKAVGCVDRDSSFEVDRSLPPSGRSENKDYAKSDYDIGHMANAADLKWSQDAQNSAAILSNAAPQLPSFNRGIWKKLEDSTRGWALSSGNSLLIYTGPIYNRKLDPTIGQGRVTVPNAFFKIIIDKNTSEVQVYLFKHEGSKEMLKTFITSLANIQRQTGIVFPMPPTPIFTSTWERKIKNSNKAKSANCSIR